jgi:diphthamide biosynthesis protein 2
VTPFELEIALKADRSWTGRYVLSFEQLLAEHENNEAVGKHGFIHLYLQTDNNFQTEAETSDNEDDPDRPMFSLVTGQYRKAKKYGGVLYYLDSPLIIDICLDADPPNVNVDGGSSLAVVPRNGDETVARLADSPAGKVHVEFA